MTTQGPYIEQIGKLFDIIWTGTNDMPLESFCASISFMLRKRFEVSFGGTLLDIWPFCAIYFTAQNNQNNTGEEEEKQRKCREQMSASYCHQFYWETF